MFGIISPTAKDNEDNKELVQFSVCVIDAERDPVELNESVESDVVSPSRALEQLAEPEPLLGLLETDPPPSSPPQALRPEIIIKSINFFINNSNCSFYLFNNFTLKPLRYF